MGNMLSTEDDDEHEYVEERVKPERKKRKSKAKTAKRRQESLGDFGLFEDVDNYKMGGSGGKDEVDAEDDVIENIKMDMEYDSPKPKRKKRGGGGAVSRRRKVAWDEDD